MSNPAAIPTQTGASTLPPRGSFLVVPERFPNTGATVINLHTHEASSAADTPSPTGSSESARHCGAAMPWSQWNRCGEGCQVCAR
jgi:hypothetical protein